MDTQLQAARRPLRKDLRAIVADGAAFSTMVGIGESYLAAFALAVGVRDVTAGLVATVPLLAGAMIQLISPHAIRWLGSHRRWVVFCAACQASAFLPLIVAAILGRISTLLLFSAAALYWGSGLATGPAWNTWVARIVPVSIRARYFARRTRVSQTCVLAGFVAGGLALQCGAAVGKPLAAFALLFAIAASCRYTSAFCLASQSEPPGTDALIRRTPPNRLIAGIPMQGNGSILVYLLSVQAAVQISAPFFTPYMIKQLQLSYLEYLLLVSCAHGAKIVALPAFGKVAHRYGARWLLWIGGIGIVPIAGLWVFSDRFPYLMGVQVLSGVAWAAYELAMFLLLFDSIQEHERTSVLTTYNFFHSLATASGSLLGGAILSMGGASRGTYLALFAASSFARAATFVLFSGLPDRATQSTTVPTRTLAVRPGDASLERPILPGLPQPARASAVILAEASPVAAPAGAILDSAGTVENERRAAA